MDRAELINRIWERDSTIWTGADEAKWLGWLDDVPRLYDKMAETFCRQFAIDIACG